MMKKHQQSMIDIWGGFLDTCQEQHKYMVESFLKGVQQTMSFPFTAPPYTPPIEDVFLKAAQALAENPSPLLQAQEELIAEMSSLWEKLLSLETPESSKTSFDKRFRHDAWQTVPYFVFIKEYYLMMSRLLEKTTSHIKGLDKNTTKKVQFYIKQMVDAAAPTNSPFTNPEVLEEFVKTKGNSLRKGLETLLQDLEEGQWMKMTDPSAFKLGENIATTKEERDFQLKLALL